MPYIDLKKITKAIKKIKKAFNPLNSGECQEVYEWFKNWKGKEFTDKIDFLTMRIVSCEEAINNLKKELSKK